MTEKIGHITFRLNLLLH